MPWTVLPSRRSPKIPAKFSFERTGASIQIVGHAFYVMADAVAEAFDSLGIDIAPELEACQEAFTTAIKQAREEAAADRRSR
jgi:hypothetical protein